MALHQWSYNWTGMGKSITYWRSLQQNGAPFWDFFVFYAEPAHQKPALVVHGTREDANPSVNDKLH